MNEPLRNIKNMLSEEEKEKLKFSELDRENVFRMIQESNGLTGRKKIHVKTVASTILMPVAVVLITFMLLLQTSMKQQVLAAIPFLHSLFSEYGDEGQKKAVQKNEVQPINKTVENNGVKITFNEILYDGARISAAYTIEATDGKYKGKDLNILFFNMKVNSQDVRKDNGFSGGQSDKKIGNKYLKVQNIDINQDLPDKFTLNLSIQELIPVDNESNQTIKGNWNFSLPVKNTGETYEYKPTVSKKTDLGELRVRKIVFAPSGTQVEFEYKRLEALVSKHPGIGFRVLEPNNKEIKVISGTDNSYRYKNGIGTGKTISILQPTKKIPEFITIQPYYSGYEENTKPIEHIKNITEKQPIFLPQGKNGGIIIKKIEKKQGEVWVHFDVTGNFIRERKNQFQLINGKELTRESFIYKEGDDLNNGKPKNQIIKFKTPYSEDLNFFSTDNVPEFINEWEMKIPINKKELKTLKK
jgi:hypothetical protein